MTLRFQLISIIERDRAFVLIMFCRGGTRFYPVVVAVDVRVSQSFTRNRQISALVYKLPRPVESNFFSPFFLVATMLFALVPIRLSRRP